MNNNSTSTEPSSTTLDESNSTQSSTSNETMSTTMAPEKGFSYWKCLLGKFSLYNQILSGLNELFGPECDKGGCSRS